MMEIPFTQYLRPDGRQRPMVVDRPDEIALLAKQIMEAGHTFEAEVLTTGVISLTISDGEQDVASALSANGPEVIVAVDKMITDFAATLQRGTVDTKGDPK